MKRFNMRDLVVWRTGSEEFGDTTGLDLVSFSIGFFVGLAWLIIAFTVRQPDDIAFFWITQNIFGACMCVTFMKTIRLNSIHVASILLTVAFFYDIFFVFVTPLLFKGKSVMITVATSGGRTGDDLWCEKYPDDVNCQGGNPLPMLLTMPRFFDYQGGSSLLGLGDIVLPGLLLSFAARFDAAKCLLGVMGGGSGSMSNHCPEQRFFGRGCRVCANGYFTPLVIAYAVGLLMANTAVYMMQMGQPALLYLVPCCLGTLGYIGWRRQELHELWNGPRALRAADKVLYGDDYNPDGNDAHVPLPVEEGSDDVLATVPSASADDDDDFDIFPILEETTSV
jgi:signal peptide peptidase-like 2B